MLCLFKASKLEGAVRPPGDKSLCHRYAILAAVAGGESQLKGFNECGDCLATLECLEALGVPVRRNGTDVRITGVGLSGLRSPSGALDARNSGTTARLLAGIIAGAGLEAVIDGDESLRRRPMERVAEPLRAMGAEVRTMGGRLPMRVRGARLRGIDFSSHIPSAQVRSAVMLAALSAEGATKILVEPPTRDHTERALQWMGVVVRRIEKGRLEMQPPAKELPPLNVRIPGDASAAAYLAFAAAALPGSELKLNSVLLNPTRTAFLTVLRRMGAAVEVGTIDETGIEPRGDLIIRGGPLRSMRIAGDEAPLLIDELPAVAAATATVPGLEFRLSGAGELRLKESDRIALLARNLTAMGAQVDETADGLAVKGAELKGIEVKTGGDHRIAMALAIAALKAEGKTTFDDPACVGISYPSFFTDLLGVVSA
jgi:3-phosphoshikimate 1-carboxyvinyltransferase